ncbi:DUF551 domain-containing protein [Klebsiella pneumoniae]|uniref:DUF551 domain-containing protein n=1 Tax=Klebsiella pneumoniae TaxID=573 RepID=UPI003007EED2
MTSKLSRDRLQEIAEDGFLKHGESKELARMALAALDSEPVAIIDQANLDYLRSGADADVWPPEREEMGDVLLYRHAQPAPVVPENCVTAEHRRVIEMLLNVCGAAFELADDSCQQDVDGEDCHVVPDDAFQKLSDALDEIENTLPTEDIDRPDVFLAWSAMPRTALKSLLQAGNSPAQSDCCPAQNHVSPEQNGDTPAQSQGWIQVSEQMPEAEGHYLVWTNASRIDGYCDHLAIATYQGGGWSNEFNWLVTHWMPLPAAPQGVIHG